MKKPLISIIITTKNEEANIRNCLMSITKQSYKNYEIIVVDNNSTDKTKKISKEFTNYIFNCGPERSAQRNYGAKKAKGEYLLFLDADMILTPKVLISCIETVQQKTDIGSLIIPEKSFGDSFWAKCKALERSCYEKIEWIEAARFFKKQTFDKIGGFDVTMISGEDWNIHQRAKKISPCGRIDEYIMHNEGNLTLLETVRTKYYYAKYISKYKKTAQKNSYQKQASIVSRYSLFFSKPQKLFLNPVVGVGMLFMKFCEYTGGLVGYIMS